MTAVRVRLLLVVALLTGCAGLAAPEPEGPLTGDRLVAALQDGGYVLFLRHTESTAQGSDDRSRPQRCAGQRRLTETGREHARAIGRAFAELDLPVGRVVASPLCRTAETARLAFGRVEPDRALLPPEGLTLSEPALAAGRALLGERPEEGNTVLVGHSTSIRALAGVLPREGGTVVFRPDGDGAFQLVAEVPPRGWERLAARRQGATGS